MERLQLRTLSATVFVLLVATAGVADAHPGRTDGRGGHTCRTNCPGWGLGWGEYHYHGGGGSGRGGRSGWDSDDEYIEDGPSRRWQRVALPSGLKEAIEEFCNGDTDDDCLLPEARRVRGALRKLRRYTDDDAGDEYRTCALETPDAAPSAWLACAYVRLRIASTQVTLTIRTRPSGANVYVDGVHACESPCAVQVEIGEHAVAAARLRFVPVSKKVVLHEALVAECQEAVALPKTAPAGDHVCRSCAEEVEKAHGAQRHHHEDKPSSSCYRRCSSRA